MFRMNKFRIDKHMLIDKDLVLVNKDYDLSGNHFTVIVGNNGTGKSTLLGEIAREVSRYKGNRLTLYSEITRQPERTIAISNSPFDKFPLDMTTKTRFSSKSNKFYKEMDYYYIGYRGRSVTKHSRINKSLEILMAHYLEKQNNEKIKEILGFLGYEPVIEVSYRIRELDDLNLDGYQITFDYDKNSYEEKLANEFMTKAQEYNIKREDIKKISDSEKYKSQYVVFTLDYNSDDRDEVYEDYKYLQFLKSIRKASQRQILLRRFDGTEVNILNASSGEGNIISSLLPLIPVVRDNSMVLIDEPEISLHPYWQYRFFSVLEKIFAGINGCHIIISSHSHFIISDLPSNCSTVISLKNDKDKIVEKILDCPTYGWSAEDILLNVFGLSSTRSYALSVKLSDVINKIGNVEEKDDEYRSNVSFLQELYPDIKEDDPLKRIVKVVIEYDESK